MYEILARMALNNGYYNQNSPIGIGRVFGRFVGELREKVGQSGEKTQSGAVLSNVIARRG